MSIDELTEKIESLEQEKIQLIEKMRKNKRKPTGEIAYIFLTLGIILLALSVIHESHVSAIIGLALSFWGCLLTYLKPTSFVWADILKTSVIGLDNVDFFLKEFNFLGNPRYISIGSLKGLRDVIFYVPKSGSDVPSEVELASDKFFFDDPVGVKLVPSGLGLVRLIEEDVGKSFNSMNLDLLGKTLTTVLVNDLELADSIEILRFDGKFEIMFRNPMFEPDSGSECKIQSLSDPLISSVACALALATNKQVMVESVQRETDTGVIKISYKFE